MKQLPVILVGSLGIVTLCNAQLLEGTQQAVWNLVGVLFLTITPLIELQIRKDNGPLLFAVLQVVVLYSCLLSLLGGQHFLGMELPSPSHEFRMYSVLGLCIVVTALCGYYELLSFTKCRVPEILVAASYLLLALGFSGIWQGGYLAGGLGISASAFLVFLNPFGERWRGPVVGAIWCVLNLMFSGFAVQALVTA